MFLLLYALHGAMLAAAVLIPILELEEAPAAITTESKTIMIPAEKKQEILDVLDKKGINEDFIYPD